MARKLHATTMGWQSESIITFKPMFGGARSSRKGPERKCSDQPLFHHKKPSKGPKIEEPESPKVGCMGHIKMDKVVGLSGNRRLFQLKKIFSGKLGGRTARRKMEMDPPLPVTRQVAKGSDGDNLWKRRFGYSLEGLQLQHRRRRVF